MFNRTSLLTAADPKKPIGGNIMAHASTTRSLKLTLDSTCAKDEERRESGKLF
jgi:Rad51